MSQPVNTDPRPGSGPYFYLSYAHSPPLAGNLDADPDHWVRAFFRDLTKAVNAVASPQSGLSPGFFDKEIPFGSDWKASITGALQSAQVFVPLYSPSYFARSLPGREWACFQQRLAQAGIEDPVRRFAPVLWIPLPGDRDLPGLPEALAMGGAETAYRENGLRALLRLAPYRGAYQAVVERVAARIVALAERDPLAPSEVPDIDGVPSAFNAEEAPAVFTVAVAAPVRSALPAGRDPAGYADTSDGWQPFGKGQGLPLAAYAARAAEQLDFAVVQAGIEKADDMLSSGPGVILIDPWFLAAGRGPGILQAAVRDLPSWVLPLLVMDPEPDTRAATLAEQARTILHEAGAGRSEAAKRAISGVRSAEEFATLMPVLVAEAERQYLRHGPVLRSTAQPGSRPRLTGPRRQAGPVVRPQGGEEERDA